MYMYIIGTKGGVDSSYVPVRNCIYFYGAWGQVFHRKPQGAKAEGRFPKLSISQSGEVPFYSRGIFEVN